MSDDIVLVPEPICEQTGRHQVIVKVYEMELQPIYTGSRWIILHGTLEDIGNKISPKEFNKETYVAITKSCCLKAAAATGIKDIEENI